MDKIVKWTKIDGSFHLGMARFWHFTTMGTDLENKDRENWAWEPGCTNTFLMFQIWKSNLSITFLMALTDTKG